jgi:hypothetical protein
MPNGRSFRARLQQPWRRHLVHVFAQLVVVQHAAERGHQEPGSARRCAWPACRGRRPRSKCSYPECACAREAAAAVSWSNSSSAITRSNRLLRAIHDTVLMICSRVRPVGMVTTSSSASRGQSASCRPSKVSSVGRTPISAHWRMKSWPFLVAGETKKPLDTFVSIEPPWVPELG